MVVIGPRLVVALVFCALVTGCASPEWTAARNSCAARFYQEIPPSFAQALVNKTRAVQVPDGSMHCRTRTRGDTSTTDCTPGTRWDYIPYSEWETVDVNDDRRRAAIANCTTSTCLQLYGNADCEARR